MHQTGKCGWFQVHSVTRNILHLFLIDPGPCCGNALQTFSDDGQDVFLNVGELTIARCQPPDPAFVHVLQLLSTQTHSTHIHHFVFIWVVCPLFHSFPRWSKYCMVLHYFSWQNSSKLLCFALLCQGFAFILCAPCFRSRVLKNLYMFFFFFSLWSQTFHKIASRVTEVCVCEAAHSLINWMCYVQIWI